MKKLWPIALVVASNILYHICAKQAPDDMNAFALLTVTYGVAFIVTLLLYFILKRTSGSEGLFAEYRKANWAPFALGFVIIGLEVGWIMAYKAGWQVSMGYIVVTAIVSSILLFVGYFLYKEKIDRNKIIGIALCLIGLVIINL